ncbi:MAG: hypothetical protein GY757_51700, partial [bacterium]|nr:hypothetical protein [bacterium]
LDYPGFKKIYTAGITHNENTSNTMQQSQEAFAIMKKILTEEGMEFSQVIRQWNYIENIVGEIADKKETLQNYQVFNDIRSQYYDESDFKNGYPAATGIGMHHGGVILDFIAADIQGEKTVVPIENPIQIDAHHYSQEVLVGKALQGLDKKTTPKFERAKAFKKTNGYYIYISGTAAIKGQKVVFPENAEEQTRVTIENMAQLVSASNLEKHGLTVIPNNTTYSHIRIYVKFEKDLPGIKKICRQHFKDVPSLYLLSDICRGNLLVEIEGAVFVPAPQPG